MGLHVHCKNKSGESEHIGFPTESLVEAWEKRPLDKKGERARTTKALLSVTVQEAGVDQFWWRAPFDGEEPLPSVMKDVELVAPPPEEAPEIVRVSR